ncbi:hypothetical protein [Streptomyces sp. NPDC046887]|uniref:hypothetical protein n=1 Tax=Streptomyces sp. NPDC046887 TaxID=3155472 RepID=UPI0033E33289
MLRTDTQGEESGGLTRMPWDEWEQLKAEAAKRTAAPMQINQTATGPEGGEGSGDRVGVDHVSLNGNANVLVEMAGLLYEGRPDGDLCTTARSPRSHPDVAAKVDTFARFANDQYQDTTALLAALSTRLRKANGTYATCDGDVAGGLLNAVLDTGLYVSPEDR